MDMPSIGSIVEINTSLRYLSIEHCNLMKILQLSQMLWHLNQTLTQLSLAGNSIETAAAESADGDNNAQHYLNKNQSIRKLY